MKAPDAPYQGDNASPSPPISSLFKQHVIDTSSMPSGAWPDRRGVTPIIASLMLIVISVASGAVAYVFIAGYLSHSAPPPPTSAISVDSVSGNSTNVTIYMRNTGPANITVDYVYVYTGGSLISANDVDVVVSPGTVGTVVIPRGGMVSNTSYNFQMVCSGNTMTATFNSYV